MIHQGATSNKQSAGGETAASVRSPSPDKLPGFGARVFLWWQHATGFVNVGPAGLRNGEVAVEK